MQAMRPDRYEVVPIYITRDGRWLTGAALRDLKNFQTDDLAERMGVKEVVISPNPHHRGMIIQPIAG